MNYELFRAAKGRCLCALCVLVWIIILGLAHEGSLRPRAEVMGNHFGPIIVRPRSDNDRSCTYDPESYFCSTRMAMDSKTE